MKRRDLLAALGGMVVWPYSIRAQTVNQRALPHVAILGGDFIGGYDFTSNVAPLLSELGLLEGQNFRTETVFVTGHDDFAAELGKRPVAVIVVQGERTIKTAKDVPMPAADGITFTCDGTAMPMMPTVCSNKMIRATVAEGGRVTSPVVVG